MRFLSSSLLVLVVSVLVGACQGGGAADGTGTSFTSDDGGTTTPHVPTACESYCGEASRLGGQAGGCDPSCAPRCAMLREKTPDCANELDDQLKCYVENINLCNCDSLGYFLNCADAATSCAAQIAVYSSCVSTSTTASAASTQ